MASTKQLVESAIAENRIVIFSKSYCPYCQRAKGVLAKHPSLIYELDERDDGSDIQNYLAQKTGQRTVPNIFIKQQHIGGSDDLAALERSGQLAKLLAA
ncbi:glutaredoxin [Dacryopinax primogenitus]|uniref:Glutaredoxin n=1 Tax=Dacryopinax primogenitus (strain DJM 731) TaxID=1858805 RepID=M5G2C1_DACPD|nr:glutaredoxin [Dacryopinax primogenitus]EJU02839.1 glutaredoxin [Dacryopinax primogenitus]